MMPLDIDPLITGSKVRDRFALEFGADVLHFSYSYYRHNYSWTQVAPVVGMMWNVWLSDRFVIYPKIELGYAMGWFSGWDSRWDGRPGYGGVSGNFTAGLMYRMKNDLTLRAEAGYAGMKLGVGWLF